MGECGLRSSSKREPKPHGPLSPRHGFSALALLTFCTGQFFVQEAVLCIVRRLAAFRDVSNAPVVATKTVAYILPKIPDGKITLVLNHWPR